MPVESDDPENTKCLLAITTDTGDTYYLAGTKEVMLSMDQLTDNVRLKAAGFVKEISPEKRHFFVDSYEPVSAE